MKGFWDGLSSVVNSLVNSRAATNTNRFTINKIDYDELRAILHTGLGSKIVRLKVGAALSETMIFASDADRDRFNAAASKHVRKAASDMLAFGRGIVVVYKKGDDLSKPITGADSNYLIKAFSGDMVTAGRVSIDLMSERYYKPIDYVVNAEAIHYSRVVDFTYVEPSEHERPNYMYGGIPEFELIYPQLVQDGIIERATPAIIDKNASLFYKVRGFKNALKLKKDDHITEYFSKLETMRSVMGASIIDEEDSVEVVTQQLTNLSDVDRIGLRRLAMVTGIPLPYLVGEAVQGLNSTGDNERAIWGDTVKHIQASYLIDPINELAELLGMGAIEFKPTQGTTQKEEAEISAIHVTNAVQLATIGEDYEYYLRDNNVIEDDG